MKKRIIFCWIMATFISSITQVYALCVGVNCKCTVNAVGLNFGTYAPTNSSATTGTGSITVTCTVSTGLISVVSYSIALSKGSGAFSQRTLTSGTNTLNYNIYTTNAYATIWGDGTSGTSTQSVTKLNLASSVDVYTTYGRLPALQNVSPGPYQDTIVITVTY